MDTETYTKLEDYLEFLARLGFKVVLKQPFLGKEWKNLQWHPQDENYYILWREPLLVSFDSHGRFVNGGYVWYNWKPNPEFDKNAIKFYSEIGHWHGDIWITCHDCRIDFLRKLTKLEQNGVFISPWIEHPKLWLVNYAERYDNIDNLQHTLNRLALLPEEVRRCVRVQREDDTAKQGGGDEEARPPDREDNDQERRCGC